MTKAAFVPLVHFLTSVDIDSIGSPQIDVPSSKFARFITFISGSSQPNCSTSLGCGGVLFMTDSPFPPVKSTFKPPSAAADFSAPVNEAAIDDVDGDLCLLITELLLLLVNVSVSPLLLDGSCHVDDELE